MYFAAGLAGGLSLNAAAVALPIRGRSAIAVLLSLAPDVAASFGGAEPPGAAKGQREVELPPWSKGRYGTALDDGTIVEGFVDLMYREDDGSNVIIDYKTDDIPDTAIPRAGRVLPAADPGPPGLCASSRPGSGRLMIVLDHSPERSPAHHKSRVRKGLK